MTSSETLRDAWYVAAYTSELEEKGMIATTLLGDPIVIYAKTDGSPVALEDRCVHRLAPLSLGRVEGDHLRCMYHGMLFSAEGAALEIPGQDLIPKRACVRSYPVVERSGWLWVWPGNPERADEALVPPVIGMRHPDWFLHEGLLDYDASSDLIITNVIDLGHLTWVHRESFGADEAWAETVPTTSPIERGVRVTRWLREIPPIPPLGKAADHERLDHWTTFDFFAPGVFHFYNAMYPVGTYDKYAGGEPDRADETLLYEHYTQQFVMPMTEQKSRYFFTWGPSTRVGNAEEGAIMREVNYQAFAEDQAIIEAQQKIINLDPSRRPMPTVHDKAVTLYEGIVRKLVREQNAALGAAPALEQAG
ncbi:Rieske 2Fe-2S domain-containing protein [Sphingopyxis sp.]|jgi:vanillate O-demethylase monooxygenase subunit|uniref:Rieske 2Fe-2S domain-containing protein n=1 Tax=Sphingopyxis sp. TaxID=1908224 RepID=UPI003D6CBD97